MQNYSWNLKGKCILHTKFVPISGKLHYIEIGYHNLYKFIFCYANYKCKVQYIFLCSKKVEIAYWNEIDPLVTITIIPKLKQMHV